MLGRTLCGLPTAAGMLFWKDMLLLKFGNVFSMYCIFFLQMCPLEGTVEGNLDETSSVLNSATLDEQNTVVFIAVMSFEHNLVVVVSVSLQHEVLSEFTVFISNFDHDHLEPSVWVKQHYF